MNPFESSDEKDHSEFRIHVAIIHHLRGQQRVGKEIISIGNPPFLGLLALHIYQGRSKEEGFFLKLLGVVAGAPDILCIWPDPVKGYDIAFLEVKSTTGNLSTPQQRFRNFCQRLGIKWAIVRSVTEAHNQLITWGLTPHHNAIREPDTRSDMQKKKDAFDFFKP